MSDENVTRLIIVLVLAAFASIPMLARSWRALLFLATAEGLVAIYFWMQAFLADWDKTRMAASVAAVVTTWGLLVGLGSATFRLVGRERGWRAARFPVPQGLVFGGILLLLLLWWVLVY